MRLLLIDDDGLLLGFLAKELRANGHVVDTADSGEEGLSKALGSDYSAIVLDVVMPKMDGWQVLAGLRRSKRTPVLMLTSRNSVADKVTGLDAGADDHLAKPFDLPELLARLRAVVRRSTRHTRSVVEVGDIRVDLAARTITRGEENIALSPREFAIVELLSRHLGEVVTRSALYEGAFDENDDSLSNVIDVHVARIRKKLGRDLIVTHHGHGYSFGGRTGILES